MRVDVKLSALTAHNTEAHEKYKDLSVFDSVEKLSADRIAGWKKILSSVATTEGIENTLMDELEKAFQDDPEVLTYLVSHKLDEWRHHEMINRYLKNTFQYVKTHRTFTDQVIYDTLLPQVSKLFVSKPVYGLALLLFFEVYGVVFYKSFKGQAEADGLVELTKMIQQIEKDELRHMAGMNILLSSKYWKERDKKEFHLNYLDKAVIRLLLSLMCLDVNLSRFAVYNREVREHIRHIGIDPDRLTAAAYDTAKEVFQRVTKKEVLC